LLYHSIQVCRQFIDTIADLAKINYYQENDTLEGFDVKEYCKIKFTGKILDNQPKQIPVPLIDKKHLKLSASKLETYNECPLKFKYAHVLDLPTAPKAALDKGASIHAVIERLTHLESEGIEITEQIAFEILDKEWIISSFKSETEANQAKDQAKQMLRTYLCWRIANPNSVVSAEQKFTISINDIPLNGYIDRVERTPEGDYEVIDFKTGSADESKNSIKDNIQINVYSLATEKLYGILPKRSSLFYLKKNKLVANPVERSHLEKVKRSLEDNVESILREEFTAIPSYKACRKCDFQTICDEKKIR
jgi:DNA helicase-2/ATP-dependent DNA helicase PcrA